MDDELEEFAAAMDLLSQFKDVTDDYLLYRWVRIVQDICEAHSFPVPKLAQINPLKFLALDRRYREDHERFLAAHGFYAALAPKESEK